MCKVPCKWYSFPQISGLGATDPLVSSINFFATAWN